MSTQSLDYPDAETRRRTVLVAVMNNPEDLCRAASDGWYRIPQRRAPRRIGADYLAFYQKHYGHFCRAVTFRWRKTSGFKIDYCDFRWHVTPNQTARGGRRSRTSSALQS